VRLSGFSREGVRFEGHGNVPSTYIAVLLALRAKRPVKVVLTREEVFVDVNRDSQVIHIKDGVKKDGTLVARR